MEQPSNANDRLDRPKIDTRDMVFPPKRQQEQHTSIAGIIKSFSYKSQVRIYGLAV